LTVPLVGRHNFSGDGGVKNRLPPETIREGYSGGVSLRLAIEGEKD